VAISRLNICFLSKRLTLVQKVASEFLASDTQDLRVFLISGISMSETPLMLTLPGLMLDHNDHHPNPAPS
jgi:hypothetical protein